MDRTRKLRIITGLIAMILIMVAVFALPSVGFFAVVLVILWVASAEFIEILRPHVPSAPLKPLLVLMPISAVALSAAFEPETFGFQSEAPFGFWILSSFAFVGMTSSLLILFSKSELKDALPAIGILVFGIPYFAVAAVCMHQLHRIHPWIAFILILLVAGSDTGAYFVGSWIGRRRIAPRISPKKSWEGSIGGLILSLIVIAVWCRWAFDTIDPRWVLLAAVTVILSQLGDLLESLAKRGTGVKDSSQILPGHGGFYDRVDAMMLAAPVFLIGIRLLGLQQIAGQIP